MPEQIWKVGRSQGACAACERSFEAGEDYLAALTEAPDLDAQAADAVIPEGTAPAAPDARDTNDEAEAGNWLRFDYCKSCWEAENWGASAAARIDSAWLAYWKASWEPPSANRRRFDRQTAIDVFRRTGAELQDEGEPLEAAKSEQRLRLRYVLALMLMRKKVLKFAESGSADGRRLVLRESEGTLHVVEVPAIAADDAEALTEEIARIMGW